MTHALLIIIAVLLGLVALFLFLALRQNSVFEKQNIIFEDRIKALEDKNNPHNFSHPSTKVNPNFDKNAWKKLDNQAL